MPSLFPSFRFNVVILGEKVDAGSAFFEVSGLEKEIKTEEVACGGENRFKYKLPLAASSPNLVLKGGVTSNESPLSKWGMKVLDGGLGESIKTKNLQVQLLNEDGNYTLLWNFYGAYPLKWHFSDLNSKEGNILIETAELAYKYSEFKRSRKSA